MTASTSTAASRAKRDARALTDAQIAALAFVEERASLRAEDARQRIDHILRMSNIERARFERAKSEIESHARVALHFHPDRPGPGPEMKTVVEALLGDGIYRSQFETGISNGGVSAYPGGARTIWEDQIFGAAYTSGGADAKPGLHASERPKYGALDLMGHADGPSPRFGSCYLLLAKEVSRRCTFTYLDSHDNPDEKGTIRVFDDVLAALMTDAFTRDFALGERDLTPVRLVDHLTTRLRLGFVDPANRPASRNLDHYIEAQVHGEVQLGDDADMLVADPAFAGTRTGDDLERLCERFELELVWHGGFALAVADVPSDFRGSSMPSLADRIAPDGIVDAHRIGQAAIALRADPAAFDDRGSEDEVRQELKLLWHVLVRYGRPRSEIGVR